MVKGNENCSASGHKGSSPLPVLCNTPHVDPLDSGGDILKSGKDRVKTTTGMQAGPAVHAGTAVHSLVVFPAMG